MDTPQEKNNQIIIYNTEDGETKIEVKNQPLRVT